MGYNVLSTNPTRFRKSKSRLKRVTAKQTSSCFLPATCSTQTSTRPACTPCLTHAQGLSCRCSERRLAGPGPLQSIQTGQACSDRESVSGTSQLARSVQGASRCSKAPHQQSMGCVPIIVGSLQLQLLPVGEGGWRVEQRILQRQEIADWQAAREYRSKSDRYLTCPKFIRNVGHDVV